MQAGRSVDIAARQGITCAGLHIAADRDAARLAVQAQQEGTRGLALQHLLRSAAVHTKAADPGGVATVPHRCELQGKVRT